MGLFDKLRSRVATALIATVLTKMVDKYKAGELTIVRRASREGDAVTPERQSAITYEFHLKTPLPGVDPKSLRYNPDRGREVEPNALALEPGVVTDSEVGMAVLLGMSDETIRAAYGEDRDVVPGPASVSVQNGAVDVKVKKAWKLRR